MTLSYDLEMNATIDVAVNINSSRINKYLLMQSSDAELVEIYNAVFDTTKGSLTVASDNDAHSKIKIAIANLNPTNLQEIVLEKLSCAFASIEKSIDPDRLQFDITKGFDDEIYVNRTSKEGVSTLIINDDGSHTYSFIAFRNVDRKDKFIHHDVIDTQDFESLAFQFLSI